MIHKDLQNPNYVSWKKFLKDSENWDSDEIKEYEFSEICRLIDFAYKNTEGYRSLFDRKGIHPSDIKLLEDFAKIPFITKSDIRDNLEMFSANVSDRQYITTGGSTGIPTGMYRNAESFAKELASKGYQYNRIGWKEGDRQIVFRGLKIDSADGISFAPEFSELRCSTYDFTPEKMETYRQQAFEYQPDWIRCYPSSGYIFARYLKDHKKAFPKIKGVLCSSEQLYDFQKKLFREVFGDDARIFVHYGHYEMSALAGFCEYTDDYHVLPQYGYTELLDKDDNPVTKRGQVGEIVATSFIMNVTPFIRFRTEDLAIYKGFGCEKCGRPYQIWEKIEGRLQELVVSKNNRTISTSMLNMHDDSYDHLKQFQFHQSEPGKINFRFIPKTTINGSIIEQIKAKVVEKLGADFELNMESVTEIPLTKRGKHRLLVQELDLKYDHPSLSRAIGI
jgi:phenylacetate-CoA ligase